MCTNVYVQSVAVVYSFSEVVVVSLQRVYTDQRDVCKHNSACDNVDSYTVKPNTHRRRDETVLSRRRRRCEHNSRRLPTNSVDNFETDQTDSIAFDYTNFDKY